MPRTPSPRVAAAALAALLAALFINVIAAAAGSPGTVSFTSAEYEVGEGAGKAVITLTRTGGAEGAATARVSLADVTTGPADHQFRPGSVDPTFALVWQVPNFFDQQAVALQRDGKVIVGGSGTPLQRLNADGTPDTTFRPPAFNAPIETVAVQPDGKVVVSGTFNGIPGMLRIARLNPDGSLDTTFNAGAGLNDSAKAIVVQPDGKLVICGFFTTVNLTWRPNIARLNADGSLDAAYNPALSSCYRLALQEDGKVLAAGSAGTGIVRLNTDGTKDAGFNAGPLFAGVMLPQPGGKLYVGGGVVQNGVVTGRGVYLLNPDGSRDASFDTGAGTPGETGVAGLAMQPDGKLIAGGNFTAYKGVTTGPLVRLNPDGSVDPSFQTAQFFGGAPYMLSLFGQPDGKFIAIGNFTSLVPGGYRSNIARFNGDLFVNWADGDAADKTFAVPVSEEQLDESDETATLTVETLPGGAAVGAIPSATLRIVDNDDAPAFTSAPPARAIAGVSYNHAFTASGNANGSPAVFFSVTSGALPPGLFLSSNGVLSGVPAATGTYAGITVTAANGIAPAATQTFDLVVASGGALQFSATTYSVAEDGGTATLTVNRVGGSAGAASVVCSTFGNTAVQGTDYVLTTTKLDFADGETSKTVTVAVNDDEVNERDETANVSLTTATGSARIGVPASATLTILNDDPLPSISVNDIVVTEGDAGTKSATFTVTRTGLIDRALTFAARTADGTAAAGEDYVTLNGQFVNTFQIPASSVSANVSVSVYGDTLVEPDKSFFLELSSPTNATIARGRGACEINDNDTTVGVPTVQFAAREFRAQEGAGLAAVTVTRSGDLSAPATVNYTTALAAGSGAASDRGDFTFAVGTLRFAAGESSKVLNVFVTDDALAEGDEFFSLVLGAPAGGASVGVPGSTLVRILDNDGAAGPNPTDETAFFVRQHYRDFLGRDPDAAGLAFWTGEVEQCGADAACREVRRVNVSAAFFLSIEFKETGYFVYLLHKAAFNTGERLPLRTYQSEAQQVGRDAVVGSEGWEQKLAANKQAFAEAFVARAAFTTAYPATMTAAQFVDALNANTGDPLNPTAGGSLAQAERDQLVADLASGAKTRAQVLRAVAENDEYRRRQLSKAFVLMQYFGYLRRAPNETPDAGFDGYNFWLSKLNEFRGNYIEAEMVKAFISSDEYRKRFGQ